MPILPFLRSRAVFCSAIIILSAGVFSEAALAQDVEQANRPGLQSLVIVSDNKKYRFKVEVAHTPEEQRKGLMHREKLKVDHGMLFAFKDRKMRSFWMHNTNIALDMLFIGKDGEIRHIHHNAEPNNRKNISSQVPVRAVLEINGGLADQYGIENGDTVHHALFSNALAP
jgi:hypothetical protein